MRELKQVAERLAMQGIPYTDALADFQWHFIAYMLRANKDNVSETARKLGIHRNTLTKIIERRINR